MSFLTWDNQEDAEACLDAVNATYGCPHVADNGYRMDQWAFVSKSNVTEHHGFVKPKEHLGMKMTDLMPVLVPGFVEHEVKPDDFNSPEDEV